MGKINQEYSMERLEDEVRDFASLDFPQRTTWWNFIRDFFRSAIPVFRLPYFNGLRDPATVLVSGLDGAGKKTLLRHLGRRVGRDIEWRTVFAGAFIGGLCYGRTRLLTCDLGGGRPNKKIQFEMAHFRICDALIYMVDAVDRDRLVEAREELHRALRGWEGNPSYSGLRSQVPMLVLANKQQEVGAATPEEVAAILQLGPAHRSSHLDRPLRIIGVDVQSNQGIAEALNWLTNALNNQEHDTAREPLEEKQALLEA